MKRRKVEEKKLKLWGLFSENVLFSKKYEKIKKVTEKLGSFRNSISERIVNLCSPNKLISSENNKLTRGFLVHQKYHHYPKYQRSRYIGFSKKFFCRPRFLKIFDEKRIYLFEKMIFENLVTQKEVSWMLEWGTDLIQQERPNGRKINSLMVGNAKEGLIFDSQDKTMHIFLAFCGGFPLLLQNNKSDMSFSHSRRDKKTC